MVSSLNIPKLDSFSFSGHSRAYVFDLDGRILDMIHSGNDKAGMDRAEVTYTTPMKWTLDDVKEKLGRDDVRLEVTTD